MALSDRDGVRESSVRASTRRQKKREVNLTKIVRQVGRTTVAPGDELHVHGGGVRIAKPLAIHQQLLEDAGQELNASLALPGASPPTCIARTATSPTAIPCPTCSPSTPPTAPAPPATALARK